MEIKKLREQIQMPKFCPFCGEPLSEDNSELDHIVPPRLGGTDTPDNMRYVCKRCNSRKSDKYDRLFEYYYRLMSVKRGDDENLGKNLDSVLRNLNNEDMDVHYKEISPNEQTVKRLMLYASKINEFTKKAEVQRQINNMEISLDALKEHDEDDEIREKINGNTFTYKKSFPIDNYREILERYGDEEHDAYYYVYEDDQGRLVVY